MSLKKISPHWVLIAAIVSILWLPHLLSLGMFMDGVYDALLAQNLYQGISTFWAPQTIFYSQPAYWDNPPLSIGILAGCYKLFGNHYVVERIYSLACALLQLCLIVVLWRTLFSKSEKIKSYAWLPCLLWLVSPLISWSYSNNLMENTMTLFTTAALIIIVRYVQEQKQLLLFTSIIAAFLLLAFITKGPVAIFPLAFPVLLTGINKFDIKKSLVFTVLLTVLFCLFFAGLFSFHAPADFLHNYYEVQVKRTLNHTMPEPYKPYWIFVELLIATSPLIILSVIRLLMRKKLEATDTENEFLQKSYWRFLLLGLCASAPIALSSKQRSFYLLPAMIPLVTGFAAYLLPLAEWLKLKTSEKLREQGSKFINASGVLVVMISLFLCFSNRGITFRDENLLGDLKAINEKIPLGEKVIRADWTLYSHWPLRGYLLRLYGKKLCMPDEPAPAHFYMTRPNQGGDRLPVNAQKIFSGKSFDLYQLPM